MVSTEVVVASGKRDLFEGFFIFLSTHAGQFPHSVLKSVASYTKKWNPITHISIPFSGLLNRFLL
jgi:hypothetical protein